MNDSPINRTRATAVCFKEDQILMVKLLDRALGETFWVPPGGEIQEDESPYLAAERETLEETGVVVRAYPETEIVKEYEFQFEDQIYLTKTHFFLVEFVELDKRFDAEKIKHEIQSAEWAPLKLAFERMQSWPVIQTAVYDLVFPLMRGRGGDSDLDVSVSLEKSLEDD